MKIEEFEELVKKGGMTAVCGEKIDIGKQLPTVVLEELSSK